MAYETIFEASDLPTIDAAELDCLLRSTNYGAAGVLVDRGPKGTTIKVYTENEATKDDLKAALAAATVPTLTVEPSILSVPSGVGGSFTVIGVPHATVVASWAGALPIPSKTLVLDQTGSGLFHVGGLAPGFSIGELVGIEFGFSPCRGVKTRRGIRFE